MAQSLELEAIRLTPMLLGSPPPDPEVARLLFGGAVVLALVFLAWIRRITDPGPLARGEARWRYRDRSLLERLVGAVALPGTGETPGWWITRIEFGIAITAVLIGFLWLFVVRPEPMWHEPVLVLGRILSSVAFAGMWVGLGWMVRIYRAGLHNDAQATWRYRDRQS